MARRRSRAKTRRRRNPVVSLLNVAEGAVMGSMVTQTLFNTDLRGFIFGSPGQGGKASGVNSISMLELFSGTQSGTLSFQGHNVSQTQGTWNVIQNNFMNNWQGMIIPFIATPAIFRIGKRLARKPISQGNKLLKAVGLGSTVKI